MGFGNQPHPGFSKFLWLPNQLSNNSVKAQNILKIVTLPPVMWCLSHCLQLVQTQEYLCPTRGFLPVYVLPATVKYLSLVLWNMAIFRHYLPLPALNSPFQLDRKPTPNSWQSHHPFWLVALHSTPVHPRPRGLQRRAHFLPGKVES